ncbi:ABC transporter permease [Cellulomonas chengniuliangii]|uniref:ABC transporter permease n=1 Tax=Cellulomonas chengniuliangii TaxID=2968084 RepID=UPI001D0DF9F8|nr:ABC transporter permease [Cellulomonas chengniuliangii]MCC2316868.1 ABC transporter permease [Cellulomonas chengniuliangii]
MRAALTTEYRKLVTTRLWWILLIAMAVYMAFLAAVMAWSLTQGGDMTAGGDEVALTGGEVTRMVYTLAPSLGYVFPLIVGALAMTGEFRHQTITPTLLAEPRRTVMLGGKLLSSAVLGLVFGVVGTLATVATGAAVLAALGEPTYLGESDVQRTIVLSVVALTVWAVVGVGFGTLLTNQVAAIVVLLAFTQFVEPVLRVVLGFASWGNGIAPYLPGAAGEAVAGTSFYSAGGLSDLLQPWQGFLVLVGYALVFAAIGRMTTLRRDIT